MRVRLLAVLFLALLASGVATFSFADDKEDKKPAAKKEEKSEPRLRGQLPMNYRKLALSDEQIQKIYKIQAEYDDKLAELEDRIKKVKAEEKKAVEAVLTTAQKARLKEIIAEKDKDK